jgi:hypothetical protein
MNLPNNFKKEMIKKKEKKENQVKQNNMVNTILIKGQTGCEQWRDCSSRH